MKDKDVRLIWEAYTEALGREGNIYGGSTPQWFFDDPDEERSGRFAKYKSEESEEPKTAEELRDDLIWYFGDILESDWKPKVLRNAEESDFIELVRRVADPEYDLETRSDMYSELVIIINQRKRS